MGRWHDCQRVNDTTYIYIYAQRVIIEYDWSIYATSEYRRNQRFYLTSFLTIFHNLELILNYIILYYIKLYWIE